MALPSAKELKALATTCRKLGIKTFKSGDFEFTLSDEAPQKHTSKKVAAKAQFSNSNDEIESDTLEGDALLFWSSPNPTNEDTQEGINL